jgi:phosphoribosylamine-glycine ligase
MAVIGLGDTPGEVSAKIETLLAQVQPPELRHRKDVGDEHIVQQKVERMAKIRAGENL